VPHIYIRFGARPRSSANENRTLTRRSYNATVPQTSPCTDSLHHRLGAFNHLDQMVLCHHNPHRKAIIEPSLRLQRRLHQESRCQTLCTLSCDAHPSAAIQTQDPTSATGRENSARKKKEYTDPLDLPWAHLNQSRDAIRGSSRIYRKSVHASVSFVTRLNDFHPSPYTIHNSQIS
jgi:hypothetical protein